MRAARLQALGLCANLTELGAIAAPSHEALPWAAPIAHPLKSRREVRSSIVAAPRGNQIGGHDSVVRRNRVHSSGRCVDEEMQ
jgi:hypothetical protein